MDVQGGYMLFREDGVWRHYGSDPWWIQKCVRCREKVASRRRPVEECVNCWKLEVWENGTFAHRCLNAKVSQMTNIEKSSTYPFGLPLLESIIEAMYLLGGSPLAKISVGPIQVIRTGIPSDVYPTTVTDRVLILYTSNIEEREKMRKLLVKGAQWLGKGWVGVVPDSSESDDHLEKCDFGLDFLIPTRRGCWRYDSILGNWQDWFDVECDWK
jgi:hypothetical protein